MDTTSNIDHVKEIEEYIEVIVAADDMHAFVCLGPPGWGKTTSVEMALKKICLPFKHLGAYSTPLNLYNFLHVYRDKIILLDDCAGLFNDSAALAILKAATWPSQNNKRMVKWGSTSTNRVIAPEFEFTGKLIIVANSFPSTPDGNAIRSRSYVRRIDVTVEEARKQLLIGAKNKKFFPNTEIATEVAEFLVTMLNKSTLPEISFRTLKKGYRLAEVHPHWQKLFKNTLPIGNIEKKKNVNPIEIVKELASKNLKVKEQLRLFQEQTGMKERSFYSFRKDLKISWKAKSSF